MLNVDLRRALVLAACLLLLGPPARAAASVGCPSEPVARVFLPWADTAWYAALPDGGMETRAGAWTLAGDSAFVAGNEPFHVRAAGDAWSLAIPQGSSATSAPTCVTFGHPVLRFFARSTGAAPRQLDVYVEFDDLTGVQRSQRIAVLGSTRTWAPTPPILIFANALSPLTAQHVRFRFVSEAGDWRIDDVYVDPYGKG